MQCEDNERRDHVSQWILQKSFIGEHCPLHVRALVDPGSTHSFITSDVCEQLQLPFQPVNSKSRLANGEVFPVLEVCNALVSMNNFYCTVSFFVVGHLIVSAIIGLDVFSPNETAFFKFDWNKTQLDVFYLTTIAESNEFRLMIIDPPKFFSIKFLKLSLSQRCRDIQTKNILSTCGMKLWICLRDDWSVIHCLKDELRCFL